MMDCNVVKNLIVDRIDGTLDDEIIHQVDKHLENCKSCQEEYIQTGKLLNDISMVEDETPHHSLKENFYDMLDREITKMSVESPDRTNGSPFRNYVLLVSKYAAVVAVLLTIGYLVGSRSVWKTGTEKEITALKEEVRKLQQNIYQISLNKPSASERLKTINAVNKINNYDESLIAALVNTLNSDDNVNVRLAAAYALAKYPYNDFVRTSLIRSLEQQTEPIIQISLIGILVDFKDERAKPAIESIIENNEVLPEVKEHALVGLKTFM